MRQSWATERQCQTVSIRRPRANSYVAVRGQAHRPDLRDLGL